MNFDICFINLKFYLGEFLWHITTVSLWPKGVAYNLVFIIHFVVNLDTVVSDVMLSADNIALNGCLGCIYLGGQ